VVPDARAYAADRLQRFNAPVEDVLASPVVLVGTEDEIVARLQERRERWGYSYYALQSEAAEAFAPIVARLAGA
jgi:hypothetical protein